MFHLAPYRNECLPFFKWQKEIITWSLSFWQQDYEAETILHNSVEKWKPLLVNTAVLFIEHQGKFHIIFQEAACQVCINLCCFRVWIEGWDLEGIVTLYLIHFLGVKLKKVKATISKSKMEHLSKTNPIKVYCTQAKFIFRVSVLSEIIHHFSMFSISDFHSIKFKAAFLPTYNEVQYFFFKWHKLISDLLLHWISFISKQGDSGF